MKADHSVFTHCFRVWWRYASEEDDVERASLFDAGTETQAETKMLERAERECANIILIRTEDIDV